MTNLHLQISILSTQYFVLSACLLCGASLSHLSGCFNLIISPDVTVPAQNEALRLAGINTKQLQIFICPSLLCCPWSCTVVWTPASFFLSSSTATIYFHPQSYMMHKMYLHWMHVPPSPPSEAVWQIRSLCTVNWVYLHMWSNSINRKLIKQTAFQNVKAAEYLTQ